MPHHLGLKIRRKEPITEDALDRAKCNDSNGHKVFHLSPIKL